MVKNNRRGYGPAVQSNNANQNNQSGYVSSTSSNTGAAQAKNRFTPQNNRNKLNASPSPMRSTAQAKQMSSAQPNRRQMSKGTYESPLKRFARQNEGNVLSSGDSGSNLGSINDREIVKTVTNGLVAANLNSSI